MRTGSCEQKLRDAEDDAERARDRADHLERQMNRAAEEREAQRKEERRRAHPSNRLCSGEVSDFRQATYLRASCCQGQIYQPSADDGPELRESIVKCNKAMQQEIWAAEKAREVYDRITRETEKRIVEALRAEKLDEWADCLERGDYSSMAI